MSLLLLLSTFLVGIVGTYLEIKHKHNYIFIYVIFVSLFVALSISRVDHTDYYFDLSSYVEYFRQYNDQTFEIGYVFITNITRLFFGNDARMLIAIISIIEIIFVTLSVIVITNENQNTNAVKHFKINIKRKKNTPFYYFNTVFLCYMSYWGLVFSSEGLRAGLGSTAAMLAIAFLFKRRYVNCFILSMVAVLFHIQELLLISFLFFLLIFTWKKAMIRNVHFLWFFVIIFSDVIVYAFNINVISEAVNIVSYFGTKIPAISDSVNKVFLYADEGSAFRNFFSTQYIFYRMVAISLLFGDLKNISYRMIVSTYYIGLTFSSVLQYTIIFGRVQNTFLCMITIAIILWLNSGKTRNTKYAIVYLYSFWQLIMVIRYLKVG